MSTYRIKGASGAVSNQAFTLAEKTVIGSAANCDVRIEADGIALQHAEILEENGALLLRNLAGPGETMLNGEAVDQASLASGDEIRIANCRWVLQAPGLRPEKILSGVAIRPRHGNLPWLIASALLAAGALAWYRGWLPF